VAAGGPRRTAGEAVTALEEAIEIIRGVWAGEGSVSVEGEHYRIKGLHSGPAPAHPMGVWVGAYGPRMLRLTGRLGDGWLPSMGYVGPDKLAGMNTTIDAAARKAGREPSHIRRLYNISPGVGAEQLAELTLDHGMSTFILPVDNVRDVERFAAEVAPATRELVETERARRATGPLHEPAPAAAAGTSTPATRHTEGVAAQQHTGAGAHLVEVHDALRGELARLRDIVEQVMAGEQDAGQARSAINDLTLRQNNWTLGAYCQQYCRFLTGHHGLEDRSVFPHLRRSEPSLAPVLDRLEREHLDIHDILEQLDDALVGLVSGGSGTAELQQVVDSLGDELLAHLSYEEQKLVGALDRHGFQ
jgi:hypothetical protein